MVIKAICVSIKCKFVSSKVLMAYLSVLFGKYVYRKDEMKEIVLYHILYNFSRRFK